MTEQAVFAQNVAFTTDSLPAVPYLSTQALHQCWSSTRECRTEREEDRGAVRHQAHGETNPDQRQQREVRFPQLYCVTKSHTRQSHYMAKARGKESVSMWGCHVTNKWEWQF